MDGTEQWPDAKPKVNDSGIEELVTDKGNHSGAVVERVKSYRVRSCFWRSSQKGGGSGRASGGTTGGLLSARATGADDVFWNSTGL